MAQYSELDGSDRLDEASLGFLKVDDVPDRGEVVGFDVFVLEIERVLPNVDTDYRDVGEQWILVRRRRNLELPRLSVTAEPSPPTTLYASGGRIKLLLERIDRAKVALKRGFQLAVFKLAATLLGGREIPPEEGVVDVASAVELERGLESDPLARRRRLDVCLLCCIEAIYVGLMMLRMMERHDFGRDVGLQGIVSIGETRKCVKCCSTLSDRAGKCARSDRASKGEHGGRSTQSQSGVAVRHLSL